MDLPERARPNDSSMRAAKFLTKSQGMQRLWGGAGDIQDLFVFFPPCLRPAIRTISPTATGKQNRELAPFVGTPSLVESRRKPLTISP